MELLTVEIKKKLIANFKQNNTRRFNYQSDVDHIPVVKFMVKSWKFLKETK